VAATVRIGRRNFLASGFAAAGALLVSPAFLREVLAAPATPGASPYGPLGPPNEVGLMLPEGFTGRQIARGGRTIGATSYPWHFASDGQATYTTVAGGHILVSNSEAPSATGGGSSAIRFAPDGSIERAYRILGGTNLNCAGGPTPWGTWLSCEEHEGGMVWESDPAGVLPAVPRPALGNFSHEAAAVDPERGHVFLTEDQSDGCFYRFTPDSYPDLSSGVLEVAEVGAGGVVTWHRVPDPNVVTQAKTTRQQVPAATKFPGGEGLWHHQGVIYFTTKGDRKVWAYDTATQTVDLVYHHSLTPDAALNAVDNVTVSPYGDVYVCEDGGNMEICLITPDRVVAPFLRLGNVDGSVAADHEASEMVGVVFDPTGTRMYFGSQRAYPYVAGTPAADGAVYEVTGPFRLPEEGIPEGWAYGPAAGERGDALSALVPGLGLEVPPLVHIGLTGSGLRVRAKLGSPATLHLVLRTNELRTEPSGNETYDRPVPIELGRTRRSLGAGTHVLDVPLTATALSTLTALGGVRSVLTAVAVDDRGRRRVAAALSELRI
jgi:secreted PhoX family phosphatase